MAPPKRLVLFVEGEGDRLAVPVLVANLLNDLCTQLEAWADVFLDPEPFVVGNVADLTAREGRDWVRYLCAARKRKDVGAVLLLQDGDLDRIRGEKFCPWHFASRLSRLARTAGAGTLFSVATVFVRQEYESWVIACADRLAGLMLPDGRAGIRSGTVPPSGDLELAPRNAKGWLGRHLDSGYSPTRDQEPLTRLLVGHLESLRAREMRSFRRLESALRQRVTALRMGTHVVTPEEPPAKA